MIPLLALLVTATLLWSNSLNKGPLITLTCKDASGLEAGKTLVKFRSVTVGIVEQIKLAEDYQNVKLKVRMDPDTDELLNQDTKFSVVKPRVQSANITGLDTILSGYYIQLNQGVSDQGSKEFELIDNVPTVASDPLALKLKLTYQGNRRIAAGDPISYKGFIVGVVLDSELDPRNDQVNYTAIIDPKYRSLITGRTVFWINSGIEMSFGTNGVSLSTENFQNLLSGGITFDDLNDAVQDSKYDGRTMVIYENRKAAVNATLEGQPHYVVMLNSLGNLTQGSMVKINGAEVGMITDIAWVEDNLSLLSSDQHLPVRFALKLSGITPKKLDDTVVKALNAGKLCASLGSSNILVNGDVLNLHLYSDKHCKVPKQRFRGDRVIPVIDSSSFMVEMSELVSKIGSMDFEGISKDVRQDLQTLNQLMSTLNKSTADVKLPEISARLSAVLEKLDGALLKINGSNTQDGALDRVREMMSDMQLMLRELQPAARVVSQKPNSILFTPDLADPEPGADRP